MSSLLIAAHFKIHAGKLNEFKALGAQAMAIVKEKEKDALQYDWYFNEDSTECVVMERYRDSNAVFAHLGNVGEILGKVLQISDFTPEVYGDPSPELKQVITDMKAKLYSFYQGL